MPGSLICSLFSRASFPSLDIIFMIRSSKCSSRQVSFPLKRLQTETRADSLSRPCHTPTLAFCANYTIYLMCSVGVSLSKYNLHPAGQSWICAGNPVPFALKCFLLRKVLDWVGAIVALGIYKGVFNSESFPNIHGKKKKSLIINYSNAHSFLKHFKDVYIETRCLPPPSSPHFCWFYSSTAHFSFLSRVFVSLVSRKNVSFVCFSCHHCGQPREGTPAMLGFGRHPFHFTPGSRTLTRR